MKLTSTFLMVCGLVAAQTPQSPDPIRQPSTSSTPALAMGTVPVYRVTVVERTAKAINYQHRGGATKIDFQGTELLPAARGEAKVESKQGYIEIEVEFSGLQPASRNGAEYLTYVLWAITPEGRTSNLGEILLNGTRSKLDVTTQLQVFGLVVTAEPYFAVSRPSDLIVMENVVRGDTRGKVEMIDAKYELLQRGQYQPLSNPLALKLDRKQPLELYEARNALQISRASGADQFATETFQKAEASLKQAESNQSRNTGKRSVTMAARTAVQTAEDARAIAVKRQEEAALTAERQQSADREVRAETAQAAAQSEADRLMREKSEQAADAAAEADRVKRDSDASLAAAKTEADRLKAESDVRLAAAAAEADRLKAENAAQKAVSDTALEAAAKEKARLEAEKLEMRTHLLRQLNAILDTRDTARGLIVNMSDVLFDTGQHSLRPMAREKLARVAGIAAAYPELSLAVEGHTDSVGGDEYNQQLSEKRGEAVREYLTSQGLAQSAVTTTGFGKTRPVASNDTATGRQQNRRVEIVVSGSAIGTDTTQVPPLVR